MKDWIYSILLAVLIYAVVFAINAIIVWGVGVALCRVFEINYNWTFLHGLVCSIGLAVVGSYFRNTK